MSDTLFQAVSLILALSNDYHNHINGVDEEDWISESVEINVGQNSEDEDGEVIEDEYTLIMTGEVTSLECWFKNGELDLDIFIEQVVNADDDDELGLNTLSAWVEDIESMIEDSSKLEEIYEDWEDAVQDIVDLCEA